MIQLILIKPIFIGLKKNGGRRSGVLFHTYFVLFYLGASLTLVHTDLSLVREELL